MMKSEDEEKEERNSSRSARHFLPSNTQTHKHFLVRLLLTGSDRADFDVSEHVSVRPGVDVGDF